jgi:peptide/nickel transport system ATP-binding protein
VKEGLSNSYADIEEQGDNGLLSLSNISVEYLVSGDSKRALDQVSLSTPSQGYTLGIVGESGSGKTTLGLSILNLIEPPGMITSGRIRYMSKDVLSMKPGELRDYRWKEVAMVFQSAMNSFSPVKTIGDHITEVLVRRGKESKSDARELAEKMLENVGIFGRANDYPHEFSGGMRQRAVIATALALAPKILIADEPTSALDVVVQEQILALLKKQVKELGLSLIFITHEIAILCGLVDNIAVMYSGEIVETGPIDDVLFDPLHPYTEMLLTSLLSPESTKETLINRAVSTSASVISTAPAKTGCKYATRCRYVFDRCRVERPILRETKQGRKVSCHKYN